MNPADHRHPTSRWLRPMLAGAAVLVALLVVFRHPLADRLWPEARSQALREQAAKALAHGRLSVGDGSGARELYEAALAIDPDRNEAREGLARVGQAALAQARAAIAAGRYADAHRALQLAQSLSVPRPQADAVATRLRTAEAAHAGIARLLAQAQAAHAAHRLDGTPNAALPLYQRVLALQPDRIEALEGREDALADLLQDARHALERGALADAARMIAAARGYDAGHADLPAAEARLAAALDVARQQAEHDLRRGRLKPATERFRLLLAIDPGDAASARDLERAAAAWARHAERLAADFRFTEARAALAEARALAPHAAPTAAAARELARMQRVQRQPGPRMSVATRARRVRVLLAQAAAAEARGELLTPPGDSAFDKLRAARALAPDDPSVRRAGNRLLPAARECFERELRGNNLGQARACLDAWIALDPAGARAPRRRLAQRWLAVGDERLGAGELQRAQAALTAARALDASAPGLDAFTERLRVAMVGKSRP